MVDVEDLIEGVGPEPQPFADEHPLIVAHAGDALLHRLIEHIERRPTQAVHTARDVLAARRLALLTVEEAADHARRVGPDIERRLVVHVGRDGHHPVE